MLQFNPYFRPNAKELLKHPIFDELRDKDLEKRSQYKILIDMDGDNSSGEKKKKELISEIQSNVIMQLVKFYKNDSIKNIRILEKRK